MKWLKRRRPTDPAAEYIEKLNREARERELAPPTTPTLQNSIGYISADKIKTGVITANRIKTINSPFYDSGSK